MLTSCAGRGLTKISPNVELPRELADQFEVKEIGTAEEVAPKHIIPAAKPSASSVVKSRKVGGVGPWVLGPLELPQGNITAKNFQWPYRRPTFDPIQMDEELTYEIGYFGVSAGDVRMQVLPFKTVNRRKVYHFKAKVETSTVFNLVYRINDYLESFVDYDGLFSHRYHIVMDESKQTRDGLELYDNIQAKAYYWNRSRNKDKGYREEKVFNPITRFSQDALSIFYYMRLIPLEVGQRMKVPAVADGKEWLLDGEVLRKEEIYTRGAGYTKAWVIKPTIRRAGKDQKKGDILLYLADTPERYPLKLEAKVKVGTIVMTLTKVKKGRELNATDDLGVEAAEAAGADGVIMPSPSASPSP